jgi:hypothetical protein
LPKKLKYNVFPLKPQELFVGQEFVTIQDAHSFISKRQEGMTLGIRKKKPGLYWIECNRSGEPKVSEDYEGNIFLA